MGIISPKSSKRKVKATVRIRNSAKGEVNRNTSIKKMLQSIIMATFTRLLVIKMVASSRSESSKRDLIFLSTSVFSSDNALRSAGESEKKAISDADAKPEKSNNNPASTMATRAEADGALTATPLKTSANWHK